MTYFEYKPDTAKPIIKKNLYFFKLTAEPFLKKIEFPSEVNNLIISYDSSISPNDVLKISLSTETIIAEIYNDEIIELKDIPELFYIYYFSINDEIEFRLWCW